jgi:hypothetical protein
LSEDLFGGEDMSKLIDKLNKVSQVEPAPMGFGRAQQAPPKPKLLLIASLQTDGGNLAELVVGADAGLLSISNPDAAAKTIQKAAKASSNIPWGAWLKAGGTGELNELGKVGTDFVIFPAESTSLAMVEDEKIGKILELDPELNQTLLVAINDLPVDAVFIDSNLEKGYLTWHHLMLFQRFSDLLTKPLLVAVPSNVTGNELKALWKAGVDGVVAEDGEIKRLRQMIDETAFPVPRKRVKGEALVPHITPEAPVPEEEEEEEEGE